MNLVKVIKEDLNTSEVEIKKNLYHWHFVGGIILTTILTILFSTYGDMPGIQPYIISIFLNLLIWMSKEMIWYTAFTFETKFIWLSKLRKYKVFQWGEPDWKDARFSFYGSIPFIVLLAALLRNKK
jgi:hypothetical protein